MIVLKIKLKGHLVSREVYVRGYEDTETKCENRLYAVYLLFGFLPIYKQLIFIEPVPLWAKLQRAALGSSDWKSTRPFLIDASQKHRILKTISVF